MLESYYLGAKELGKTGNIFVQIYGMAISFFSGTYYKNFLLNIGCGSPFMSMLHSTRSSPAFDSSRE